MTKIDDKESSNEEYDTLVREHQPFYAMSGITHGIVIVQRLGEVGAHPVCQIPKSGHIMFAKTLEQIHVAAHDPDGYSPNELFTVLRIHPKKVKEAKESLVDFEERMVRRFESKGTLYIFHRGWKHEAPTSNTVARMFTLYFSMHRVI